MYLNLVQQGDFGFNISGEGNKDGHILTEMAKGLFLKQILFLVPLYSRHGTVPDHHNRVLKSQQKIVRDRNTILKVSTGSFEQIRIPAEQGLLHFVHSKKGLMRLQVLLLIFGMKSFQENMSFENSEKFSDFIVGRIEPTKSIFR